MNKLVAQALAKKENGEKGFTLIELLVVVIIIGILAAIAIPIFLNMREGAWRSSVESDVKNAAISIEAATAGNNGKITGLGPNTALTTTTTITGPTGYSGTAQIVVSPDNTITFTPDPGGAQTYVITGSNTNVTGTGSSTYTYSSATGEGVWS